VDQILTRGASLLPVVALGFSEWSIGVYALLYHWQSFLIHANIRIGFGPLRLLFASPEFHHWHHSSDREARDRNFAAQLPLLDALFGTLHMPRGQMPTAYGLDQPMPQRYALQLLYPFVGDSVHQSMPATAAAEPELRPATPAPERATHR
jgi:sterol desaturase/sphingolipid hydroxylase (fatty acid hydroxylase superfamily)